MFLQPLVKNKGSSERKYKRELVVRKFYHMVGAQTLRNL